MVLPSVLDSPRTDDDIGQEFGDNDKDESMDEYSRASSKRRGGAQGDNDVKPTVEELAVYFEVVVKSMLLSRKPDMNVRTRTGVDFQKTRILRMLGYHMHKPDNPSGSDQTFMNVLSVLHNNQQFLSKLPYSSLNYILSDLWQLIRSWMDGQKYENGAILDHEMGPNHFMEVLQKFKNSYEKSVLKE